MSANTAIKPSTNSLKVYANLIYPVCLNTQSINKFEAMADLQDPANETELTIQNVCTGNKLDITLMDEPEVQIESVMDAVTSEELISFDAQGKMDDPEFEEDVKAGLLLPMKNEEQHAEQPFKANLPQHILDVLKQQQDKLFNDTEEKDTYYRLGKLHGFEECLKMLGLSFPYPTQEGENE